MFVIFIKNIYIFVIVSFIVIIIFGFCFKCIIFLYIVCVIELNSKKLINKIVVNENIYVYCFFLFVIKFV